MRGQILRPRRYRSLSAVEFVSHFRWTLDDLAEEEL